MNYYMIGYLYAVMACIVGIESYYKRRWETAKEVQK